MIKMEKLSSDISDILEQTFTDWKQKRCRWGTEKNSNDK